MWAALMACIREALDESSGGTPKKYFLNDFIYENGSTPAFRTISVGNNRSTEVDGYDAEKGFNLCVGWGSPNGVALLQSLQKWLESQPASSAS